jgi:hypothetical protein
METGPYFCKHHGDRLVVAPIALRLCEQCKQDALARYADDIRRGAMPHKYDELSPDGRSIVREMEGYYKQRKDLFK